MLSDEEGIDLLLDNHHGFLTGEVLVLLGHFADFVISESVVFCHPGDNNCTLVNYFARLHSPATILNADRMASGKKLSGEITGEIFTSNGINVGSVSATEDGELNGHFFYLWWELLLAEEVIPSTSL
jgi:hypothetical protein